MLPSRQEIENALIGSWELVRGRAQGINRFDLTVDGFWRSFSVLFLLLPFYVVAVAADRKLGLVLGDQEAVMSGASFYTAKMVALVMDWVTYPVVLAFLAGTIGIKSTYGPYITVRNWTTILVIVPYTVLNLLFLIGILSGEALVFSSLLVVGWIMWFRFFIAIKIAQASFGLAVGMVVMDFFLGLVITQLVTRLFW
ncbi:hypothetical protein E1162_08060 [Rhodobacteraceae bacterium RKSG542]|uniref:hypothetical protein n=1 Tax=Pseudovibrio flavus TaxID=2529854 RepID=UPI0012BD3B14|nr:hypothetical protein [Pseudovibrio flavus]MTI17194.1 hypothetical protein [Pseudovibrio flavus]